VLRRRVSSGEAVRYTVYRSTSLEVGKSLQISVLLVWDEGVCFNSSRVWQKKNSTSLTTVPFWETLENRNFRKSITPDLRPDLFDFFGDPLTWDLSEDSMLMYDSTLILLQLRNTSCCHVMRFSRLRVHFLLLTLNIPASLCTEQSSWGFPLIFFITSPWLPLGFNECCDTNLVLVVLLWCSMSLAPWLETSFSLAVLHH
jgi:hypothetical protein